MFWLANMSKDSVSILMNFYTNCSGNPKRSLTLFLSTIAILFFYLPTFAQSGGIDTTETIDIGGIKQVIRITGKDLTKPILLYLHGAGGNSSSLITQADRLTSKLQEHFVVVLWDQREYGKTLELNKSPQPLTLKLVRDDTYKLVEYLLKKFERKKLYLVGHSMGTVLGIHIAQKYPELLYAFVAMSPPVNGVESQKIALDKLKKHFKEVNNERAIKELATVKSPTVDFEQQFIQYTWQAIYDGETVTDEMREKARPILKQYQEKWKVMFDEVYLTNFSKEFPALKCPVYIFAGRKDFSTNSTLTQKYYEKLKAPQKEFYWFENSAHNLPDSETDLMQEIIINKILLETFSK